LEGFLLGELYFSFDFEELVVREEVLVSCAAHSVLLGVASWEVVSSSQELVDIVWEVVWVEEELLLENFGPGGTQVELSLFDIEVEGEAVPRCDQSNR